MKKSQKFNLAFTIVLICLVAVLCASTVAVLSCSVAYAYDGEEQEVILAPISNLVGNQYAGVSTLKVLAFGEQEAIYLPESYYLCNPQKFGVDSGRYVVDYCGTSFLLEVDELQTTQVAFAEGISPYPDVRLTITEGQSVLLNGINITNDYTIKLIGFNQGGSKVYVSATLDNRTQYGFIERDVLALFSMPYHAISQAERNEILAQRPTPNPDEGDIIPNTSLALRIVLIIGIAIPAIIIAILLFKPSKNNKRTVMNSKRKTDYDYDEPRRPRDRDYSNADDSQRGYYPRDDRDYNPPRDDRPSRDDRNYPPRDEQEYDNRRYRQ